MTRTLVPIALCFASLLAARGAFAQTPASPPPPDYPGTPAPVAPAPPPAAPPEYGPAPPPPAYPSAGLEPGAATSGDMPAAPPAPKNADADDERKDSGLGLEWFWINADVGASYVGLDSLNSSTFALQHSSSEGGAFGVEAGVRLFFFTAGLLARDLQLSDFNLWEVDAEAAFHMRLDHVDPYFGVRGGYAFVGTLRSSEIAAPNDTSPDVAVHGFNVGLALGCDYYFNHYVSIGIDLNPEFLFLKRPQVPLPANFNELPPAAQMDITSSPLYQQSGSSIGFGLTGTAHLGVHL